MKGQALLLKFEGTKAFLTPDKSFSIYDLGIGRSHSFKGLSAWSVRVIHHNPYDGKLFVEVMTYANGNHDFYPGQLALAEQLNSVKQLTLKSINTNGLLITTSCTPNPYLYTPKPESVGYHRYGETQSWKPYVEPLDVVLEPTIANQIEPASQGAPDLFIRPKAPEKEIEVITESLTIPLAHTEFVDGGVTIRRHVQQLGRAESFTIPNPHIRAEFDPVKEYFSKVLGLKKITVELRVEIRLKDKEVISYEARSAEIDRIDKSLIDRVRVRRTRHTIREAVKKNPAKTLWTTEELFPAFSNNASQQDPFYKKDADLLRDLMDITKTKHYRHLQALTDKHEAGVMKLRFVLKPFSYVFLLHGQSNYHVVWETLNTEEATYVWHVGSERNALRSTVQNIEQNIAQMLSQGKRGYMRESEDDYDRIIHDYNEGTDSFARWSNELEGMLT